LCAGHGHARSVARLQSAVACGGEVDGVRLLSPKTIDRIFEVQSHTVDLVMGIQIKIDTGYGLLLTPQVLVDYTACGPRSQAPTWERAADGALPRTTGGAGQTVGSQAGAWEPESRISDRFTRTHCTRYYPMRHGRWLILLLLTLAGTPVSTTTRAADPPTKQPNIVFLLADDLGWTGLRCFGSDFYETPNLDRFAQTGMKFTSAYSACTVCSPTRASIMTGMYPARLHLTDFIAGQDRPWAKMRIPDWTKGLDHSYVTIAEALRDADYATAQVGKWHLNHAGRDAVAYSPKAHGFDVEVGKPRGTSGYQLRPDSNSEGESKSEYLTDYLTDKAVEFIDKSKDDPFFLYFAYHVPHTPIEGREDLVAAFSKKVRPDAIHRNPNYAAMVASLDQSVGRVLERLDRHGIADNTLVIFTSDNGGLTERYGKHDGFTENLPLRRGKGSAYEGGVRVPTIVRWPGVTPAGSVCDEPIMTIDYYPTLLEVTSSQGNEAHHASVDGGSITSLLRDPASTLGRDLFWHYPHYHAGGDSPYSAIRSGVWRLVEFHEDNRVELYNLAEDLGEQRDLAAARPEQASQLRTKLHAWREQIGAQMPTPNPEYDPARATQVGRAARD